MITSCIVSFNPDVNTTLRANFTGGLSAQATMPGSPSAPPPPPASIVTAPSAIAANTVFNVAAAGNGKLSVSGTAYKATVPSATNPASQVVVTSIDSNPPGDLG